MSSQCSGQSACFLATVLRHGVICNFPEVAFLSLFFRFFTCKPLLDSFVVIPFPFVSSFTLDSGVMLPSVLFYWKYLGCSISPSAKVPFGCFFLFQCRRVIMGSCFLLSFSCWLSVGFISAVFLQVFPEVAFCQSSVFFKCCFVFFCVIVACHLVSLCPFLLLPVVGACR